MDSTLSEEKDPRERSFRNEDYNIRRVFLRSYPLQWGGDDDEERKNEESESESSSRVRISRAGKVKKMILAVVRCGEDRNLVLSRFKDKINFYLVACFRVSFKTSTPLISR
ncbi:hypothetical protein AgCh_029996 [Apium graveolens]